MPVLRNALLGGGVSGSRLGEALEVSTRVTPGLISARPITEVVQPAPAAAVTQPAQPAPATAQPPSLVATINPGLLDALRPPIMVRPDILAPPMFIPPQPANRTATQLARGAIDQLGRAAPTVVREALNTLQSRRLSGEQVMSYLERRVRIGEALNNLARDWSDETRADFADAFQLQPDRQDVMDAIVSIAILNDRELEAELRFENTPATTPGDLQQNRRVVWQSPPAGTVLQPPYTVLLAVEYQNVAQADEVVQAILGQLGDQQGFKLPRALIARM